MVRTIFDMIAEFRAPKEESIIKQPLLVEEFPPVDMSDKDPDDVFASMMAIDEIEDDEEQYYLSDVEDSLEYNEGDGSFYAEGVIWISFGRV